jgi:hypothetical protein
VLVQDAKNITSQEIGDDIAVVRAALALLVLVEGHVLALGGVGLDPQEAGEVAAPVAVVGRGPHRHDVLVVEQLLVALLHQLVRPRNQAQAVVLVELVHHSCPKQPPHSAVVL